MRAVIVNPASASGQTEKRWRRIVERIERGSGKVDVLLTECGGDGIKIARKLIADGVRDLIVLGGDGTIGEVVSGCIQRNGSAMQADNITLGVVHQGTGGDFTRALNIPRDEDEAVDLILAGHKQRLDVGVAKYMTGTGEHTRGFINVVNIGLGAEVVKRVDGKLKKLGSNTAFGIATLRGLTENRKRSVHIETSSGLNVHTGIVDLIVANSPFMGGGMNVAPNADMSDGKADVVIIGAATRRQLLQTFPKIYSGRHIDHPLVRVERTQSITVSAPDDPQGVVLDGELVGTTPAHFNILHRAIEVYTPAAAPA